MSEQEKPSVQAELWEDDEKVIIVDNEILGPTVGKRVASEVVRWFSAGPYQLLRDLQAHRDRLNEVLDAAKEYCHPSIGSDNQANYKRLTDAITRAVSQQEE